MAANHSAGRKRKKQAGTFALLIPIYLFTLIFVFAPLIYMVFLSFTTRAEVYERILGHSRLGCDRVFCLHY